MNLTLENCPDIGAWRAWLDHEGDLPGAARHLDNCPGCRRLVDELRNDALLARAGFALLTTNSLPTAGETAVARARLEWRRADRRRPSNPSRKLRQLEPLPMFFTRFSTPWRVAAGGLAAALALSLVVAFTPEGSAAAAGFLAQFRSQQVQAIEFTPQSQADIIRSMSALNNLGTLQMPSSAGAANLEAAARSQAQQAHPATAAEAAQTVGFALLMPDPKSLPSGVSQTPNIRVSPGSQVRFTFDKAKAQSYFQSTGHPDVSLPDKFNGASLVVSIPPAALLSYSSGSSDKNEVIVVEAGELVVDTQGNVSLLEMRDFLLGLPGLPPAVVSQLRTIQSWNDTLPIPVPIDQVTPQKDTLNGVEALVVNDNSGVGSAAIWHTHNKLMAVAGSLKYNDLKKVAESLH